MLCQLKRKYTCCQSAVSREMKSISKCLQNILNTGLFCALGTQVGVFLSIFMSTVDVGMFAHSDNFLIQLSC